MTPCAQMQDAGRNAGIESEATEATEAAFPACVAQAAGSSAQLQQDVKQGSYTPGVILWVSLGNSPHFPRLRRPGC